MELFPDLAEPAGKSKMLEPHFDKDVVERADQEDRSRTSRAEHLPGR